MLLTVQVPDLLGSGGLAVSACSQLHFLFQNLICSECGDEFTLQSQLAIHLEEHRRELANTRSYTCKSCKEEFETSAELKDHVKTHYKVRYGLSFEHSEPGFLS